jgi:hypothetical protein
MSLDNYDKLLGLDDIRILELSPGKFKDEVVVQLSSSSLKTAPHYEALSYCWGDRTITQPVICSSSVISITTNLHDALVYLRYQDRSRYLWVDALCINQIDNEEKSSRIPLMGEIYASAQQVVVWLGRMTFDVFGVFNCFKALLEHLPPEDESSDTELFAGTSRQTLWIKRNNFKTSSFLDFDLKALVKLFQRPYFRRRWIVQEIVKSKHAIAVCGRETIEWNLIEEVTTRLVSRGWLNVVGKGGEDEQVGIVTAKSLGALRSGKFQRTLHGLITATSFCECTHPNDRLYSLLGLASNLHEYGNIKPNYSKSPVDVFREFAASSILIKGDLDLLPACSMSKSPFPSWVQQFDKYTTLGIINLRERSWSFKATKDMHVEGRISDDGKILYLCGKAVDTIKSIVPSVERTPTSGFPPEYHDRLKATLGISDKKCRDMSRQMNFCIAVGELVAGEDIEILSPDSERYEEFWRTVLCDSPLQEVRASGDMVWVVAKYFAFQAALFLENSAEADDQWKEGGEDIRLVECLLQYTMFNRCFGMTVGARMGQMPQNAKIGDLICVLYGGSVPYVLRPCGNGQYTYVGDCFVYGLMDGEALDMEDIKTKEFALV